MHWASVVFSNQKRTQSGWRVSTLPHYCTNYENVMFTASLGTGAYWKTSLHKESPTTPLPLQPGHFMVTGSDHFSSSLTPASNNSEYTVVNLYFLLHVIHGKYDPTNIKILFKKKGERERKPAAPKITFSQYKWTVKSIFSSFSFFFQSFAVVFCQIYNVKK